mgnify:FL=1
MALISRDSNLYTDVLRDAIKGAWSGRKALYGSGVAVLMSGLPTVDGNGESLKTGSTVRIPYWGSMGELDDVAEGDALIPRGLSSSTETATYTQSGMAAEMTRWSRQASMVGDPHDEVARQFVEASARRIDAGLITEALTTSLSYTTDAAVSITEDTVVNASELWEDELDDDNGVALLIVRSETRKAMRLLKDSTGRALYMNGEVDGGGMKKTLDRFAGYPVLCSNRLTRASGVNTSLLCRRGAMAAWYNEDPIGDIEKDILARTEITALWLDHVEHLYLRPQGGTGSKEGVIKFTTTQS